MSDKPIFIRQTRRGTFTEDGRVLYSITTETKINTEYIGDKKDAEYLVNLFVYNIVDVEDTSKDTFSNYATIADLDLIRSDRQEAIAKGATSYRSSVNDISFDNLSVAITAAKVVRDTINNLVTTYLKLKDDFVGSDDHFFPYNEEVSSLRDQFISGYIVARDARIAAQENQDLAQNSYNEAEAIRLIRLECKDTICNLSNKLTGMNTLIQTIGNKYVDTVKDIIDTAGRNSSDLADSASQTTLTTLKNYIDDNIVALGLVFDSAATGYVDQTTGSGLSLLANLAQVSYQASINCSTADTNLISATNSTEDKLSDLKEKQANKEAASQAEETALAQLTLYCPNLDPNSI